MTEYTMEAAHSSRRCHSPGGAGVVSAGAQSRVAAVVGMLLDILVDQEMEISVVGQGWARNLKPPLVAYI